MKESQFRTQGIPLGMDGSGSCAMGQQWQRALFLLGSMVSVSVQPTVLSYAAAIASVERASLVTGQLLSALRTTTMASL